MSRTGLCALSHLFLLGRPSAHSHLRISYIVVFEKTKVFLVVFIGEFGHLQVPKQQYYIVPSYSFSSQYLKTFEGHLILISPQAIFILENKKS